MLVRLNARLTVCILSILILNSNVINVLISYRVVPVLLVVLLVLLDIHQLYCHFVDLVFINVRSVQVLLFVQVVTMDTTCKPQIACWHQIAMLDIWQILYQKNVPNVAMVFYKELNNAMMVIL